LDDLNIETFPKWAKDLAKELWFYSEISKDGKWSDAQVTEIIRKGLEKYKEEITESFNNESDEI